MGGDDTEAAWCRTEKGAMPPKRHQPSHHRCWLIFVLLQLCQSSRSKNWGAYFSAIIWTKICSNLRFSQNKPKNTHFTIKGVALLVDNCHPYCLGFSMKIPKSSHHHLRFGCVGWSLSSGLFALPSTWSLEQSTTTRPPSSLTYPSLWLLEACSRY